MTFRLTKQRLEKYPKLKEELLAAMDNERITLSEEARTQLITIVDTCDIKPVAVSHFDNLVQNDYFILYNKTDSISFMHRFKPPRGKLRNLPLPLHHETDD